MNYLHQKNDKVDEESARNANIAQLTSEERRITACSLSSQVKQGSASEKSGSSSGNSRPQYTSSEK
jgi:hypothetical protein